MECEYCGVRTNQAKCEHCGGIAWHHEPMVVRATLAERIDATCAAVEDLQVTLMNHLRCLTTRAVAYGSVLHAPGPEGQDALVLLLRTYAHEVDGRPLFTELRNVSDTQAVQHILCQHGYCYPNDSN